MFFGGECPPLSLFLALFVVYLVHGEESKDEQIKFIRKQYFKGAQLIFKGCRCALTNTPTGSTLLAQLPSAKVTVFLDCALFGKLQCRPDC